jgi:hypothetical protein
MKVEWLNMQMGNDEVVREVRGRQECQGAISRKEYGLDCRSVADGLAFLSASNRVDARLTHTLQGPAVPLTWSPSALRMTTHTFDPPPSAQSTRPGYDRLDESDDMMREDMVGDPFISASVSRCFGKVDV